MTCYSICRILKSICKTTRTINDFRKGLGYKFNTQKSFVFLYTNSEISENESEKILFNSRNRGERLII